MEKNSELEAMLADYAKSIEPKFAPKQAANVFDAKNYFTIYDMAENESSKTKDIRILPNPNGGSPIVPYHGHVAYVDGKKQTFACLKHTKGEACPFCEAREELLATGIEDDKKLAKEYRAREMYIVKLIDRADEAHGPKFWRFNAAYDKKGPYDLIMGLVSGLKKNKAIMDPNEGRDLCLVIGRSDRKVTVVSSIAPQDSDVLSEDSLKQQNWLADTKTWENVFSVKNYDYLAIVVKGGIPVWNKDLKKFVDKNAVNQEESTEPDEITMGVEDVKTNILAASGEIKEDVGTEPETDDLPF